RQLVLEDIAAERHGTLIGGDADRTRMRADTSKLRANALCQAVIVGGLRFQSCGRHAVEARARFRASATAVSNRSRVLWSVCVVRSRRSARRRRPERGSK